MLDDNKKIGIGLCGIGVFCIFLGVMLFFDRTLLGLGNVAFLMGLCILLGISKSVRFFVRKEKFKGSSAYFAGIGLIIFGWPFCGFVLEIYGIWKLFAAFLPKVVSTLKLAVPGASTVLSIWPFSALCSMIEDQRRLPS
eukprot:gnl/TRDRNA2_/TRDRNA2_184706_c0_seq1.p1 gnl/TRDRNA2_/TRDRNA2_184706_c0~~gnl/TRDRNA2_/TRDRNA2_184706_c0_seq1.p1  ORF type:complete len:139 (+),score=24.73 gnl/TRDRNA2_/TRDRNA2_184706_c0_seq1:96-512(+)